MTSPSKSQSQKKMFFTTSDLLQRLNSSISDSIGEESPSSSGFELQRQMPDGSYRRAEERELAAANFQTKMKQAAEMTAALTPQQKVEWAICQRKEGNRLFAKSEYQEAMDVYLTCLVAIDASNETLAKDEYDAGTGENVGDNSMQLQCDTEIKLPVLLNLALCAHKLGMLSKAEKFCNYAIELEPGQQSVKAYFRRGKVRMLMGNYISAESDLDQALYLLDTTVDDSDDIYGSMQNKDKAAILREKQKLQQLIKQAEKNQQVQKKAMERLFKSTNEPENEVQPKMLNISGTESLQQNEKPHKCDGLYPEKKAGTRKYSTLRENPDWDHSIGAADDSKIDETSNSLQKYLQWYLHMIGRGAQKILDMIGDEENDLTTTSTTGATTISTALDKSCKVD